MKSYHLQIEIILLPPFKRKAFISFACLTVLARTSSTMVNRCDEGRHPSLVSDFKGKRLIKKYEVNFGFFTYPYQVKEGPSSS